MGRDQQVDRRGCGVLARAIAGQLVAGQLFADDLVERPIGIERPDDIVTITIGQWAVGVGAEISVGIGVSRCIQPVLAPALAVAWRGQQAVDEPFVGAGIGIADECGDLLGPGRQAGQVEADAADQGRAIGVGTEGQPLVLERLLDEAIDRGSDAAWSLGDGRSAGGPPARTPSGRSPARCRLTSAALGKFLAPCSIQRRSKLFSSADSGSSGCGGISSFETRSQSVLSSRLPGTTTGPLDPPRASDRGLLRLSFPLALSGLWHFKHRAFKSGRMSRSRLGRVSIASAPRAAIEQPRTAATRTELCLQPALARSLSPRDPTTWPFLLSIPAAHNGTDMIVAQSHEERHNPRTVSRSRGFQGLVATARSYYTGDPQRAAVGCVLPGDAGLAPVARPGNIAMAAAWLAIGPGLELHLIEDPRLRAVAI